MSPILELPLIFLAVVGAVVIVAFAAALAIIAAEQARRAV